ncbi:MAG TPA: hypothetical protein VGO60_02990 [Iamia sp.]|nr:hypothetical protein [Iamia sp.]
MARTARAPRAEEGDELLDVVAEGVDGRLHLLVGADLDLLAPLAPGVGQRPVGHQAPVHQP